MAHTTIGLANGTFLFPLASLSPPRWLSQTSQPDRMPLEPCHRHDVTRHYASHGHVAPASTKLH
ncbi:hypothetical protein E2562_034985 [Oryza meyeriana var. granulata]|uniref:Uncharacterized protein n=1 Tax=Oryza meyeriana var. granulata TaxID=110450 RepID=A0A6G1C9U0_9ORYZ|nr:hypothetical protein E2562_034985 [Oryza meyeriana var. granulata]